MNSLTSRAIPATLATSLFTLLFSSTSASLWSQPQSTSYETVITIDHFDFDCVPDTLIGYARPPGFEILPERIHWGIDSALYCGASTTHEQVTHFLHPEWDNLRGNATVINYNQDSLPDILFFYSGEVGDSSDVRDTSFAFALFGQDGIAEFDSLLLNLTDTLQETPFYALELIPTSSFIDSTVSTYSGFLSYEMPAVFIDVTEEPAPPPTIFLGSVENKKPEETLRSRLWPNPASQQATIHLHRLPPGTVYHIEILSSDGIVVYSQSVAVGSSGELFKPIDLGRLSSGYYRVVVRSEHKLLTTHELLLIK